MSVSAESQHIGITSEACIELPEELLRHAELHDGEAVEMASPARPHQLTLVNLIMELWLVDCDFVVSPLLPGFEVAVAGVISQVS